MHIQQKHTIKHRENVKEKDGSLRKADASWHAQIITYWISTPLERKLNSYCYFYAVYSHRPAWLYSRYDNIANTSFEGYEGLRNTFISTVWLIRKAMLMDLWGDIKGCMWYVVFMSLFFKFVLNIKSRWQVTVDTS